MSELFQLLVEYGGYLAVPVLILHMALDLLDKHRHGIRLHDKVSIVAYAVLAMHFVLDARQFF